MVRPAALSLPLPAAALAVAVGALVGQVVFTQSPILVLSLLVVVPTMLAVFRAPIVGVVAFAAVATLVPFAVLPVRVVVAPTFVDLAVTATLLVCLGRVQRLREPIRTTPLHGFVAAFVGLAFVSLLIGTGYVRIGGEQLRLFLKLLNSVLLFFLVVQVVDHERRLQLVIRTLLIGGITAALIGLALYRLPADSAEVALQSLGALGYPTGPDVLRPIAETETLRATGTSVDPNVFGGLLMVVGALLAAQVVAPQTVMPRWLSVAGGVAVLAGLALSYSRSAWVGFAVALAFVAMFKARRLWIGAAAGMVALLAMPAGRSMLARLQSGFGAQDPAAAMRLVEYRDAVQLILRYPVFGVGFGDAPTPDLYVGVSNIYLMVAEQMGLLGLGAFLMLLVVCAATTFTARAPRDRPLWGILAGLQAAFVAMLVAGMFDHYFFNLRFPHMVGLFWLIVGLLVVAARPPWSRGDHADPTIDSVTSASVTT